MSLLKSLAFKCVSLILCAFCAACSMANQTVCLQFHEGTEKNKVTDFLKYIKRYEEDTKSSNFYSSSYDLNGDGNDEYFYYFETYWSCGTMGCNLMPYQIKGNKFFGLMEAGFYFRDSFNSDKYKNYICVLNKKDGPWKRIKINDQIEMQYVNGFYKKVTE